MNSNASVMWCDAFIRWRNLWAKLIVHYWIVLYKLLKLNIDLRLGITVWQSRYQDSNYEDSKNRKLLERWRWPSFKSVMINWHHTVIIHSFHCNLTIPPFIKQKYFSKKYENWWINLHQETYKSVITVAFVK